MPTLPTLEDIATYSERLKLCRDALAGLLTQQISRAARPTSCPPLSAASASNALILDRMEKMSPLVRDLQPTWARTKADIETFLAWAEKETAIE